MEIGRTNLTVLGTGFAAFSESKIKLKGGEEIDVGLIVWSTGIGPAPMVKNLPMAKDKDIKPFRYNHMGMLAYIGKNQALADLPRVKGKGFSTFLFWRSAYITKLIRFVNKAPVSFDWFKAFLFGRDIRHF